MAEQPFVVSGPGLVTLKLTAKPKVRDQPFGAKIVEPYIKHANKKRGATEQLTIADFESAVVTTGASGTTIATFTISEELTTLDLSATVESLVPAGSEGEPLSVMLSTKAPRKFKIICAGVQLAATLPAHFVHLPLHETVVKQFLRDYNGKVNTEQPHKKSNVTLADVEHFKIGETTINIDNPVCKLLPRTDSETLIEMSLKAAAYERWGYDKPQPELSASTKPANVFMVRCDVVELKLTLTDKQLGKSLQDGVLVPFLNAYAKKAKRTGCSMADVVRVEVDGLSVAPSLLASSVVRPAEDAPPPKDEANADTYMADVDAAKARGASDAELADMSHSKWGNLDASDDEDEAAALAAAERAAKNAQVAADAAASAVISAAGGDIAAVAEADKAPVHARIADVEAAKAKVERLREAAAAKAAAQATAAREAAAAKAALARAPSGRTVQRRKWEDWDKVKLDVSDDEEEAPKAKSAPTVDVQ